MVWALRSPPITGGSPLLRPSPPAARATVLNTSQFLLLGGLPLATLIRVVCVAGRLPTFHAAAADQARVAFMPDTTWPTSGQPPGSSQGQHETPVSMSLRIISTRPQRFTHVRLPGPHLTPSNGCLFLIAHHPGRSTRRSMRWFEASPREGDSEGPTSFINCTAPPSASTTYPSSLQRSWHTRF